MEITETNEGQPEVAVASELRDWLGMKRKQVAKEALKQITHVLNGCIGHGKYFHVPGKRCYVGLNPRYEGSGIGLIIVRETGGFTTAELREEILNMPNTPKPNVLPEPWKAIAEKLGSVKALANKFGVSTGTLHRWARKEIAMSDESEKIYEALLREFGIDAA